MGPPAADDLNGVNQIRKYPDNTVVRVFCTRTPAEAYPSGWAYSLHYGVLEPDPPRTLEDGTIRRYDNAHEDTKGHELHVAPNPEPEQVDFPEWSPSGNDSGARSRSRRSTSNEQTR